MNLAEGEQIADCREVRDFAEPDCYLMMATSRGLVKKTDLAAFSRPQKKGIIAIKLREGDELVDVAIVRKGDEMILATASGMAIRFKESDARSMGRDASGVKGISLIGDDRVVGMVVADPQATLLTACAKGYGKRTPSAETSKRPATKAPTARPTCPKPTTSRRKPKATRKMARGSPRSIATARNGAVARDCATSRPRIATVQWSACCEWTTRTK